MDRDDRKFDRNLPLDKEAQINVVVNNSDSMNSIDLGRVLHNVKLKRRVYAWVLLFCMAAGISAGFLMYQVSKKPITVSSVVTLSYGVDSLSAPDGGELDLSQVTSSYVLQNALNGLELSQPVSLSNLRDNMRIDKILTEDSRRQQEVAASMIQDKNSAAYTQVQGIELSYTNQFVVALTNGFGNEASRSKVYLSDSELRLVLDRILAAYNDYLVTTYADNKLPDDEISIIDTDSLDILESLDLLRAAVDNLYDYCDEKPKAVKTYRSWRTGRSLNDLMANLKEAKSANVEYLYSYVYNNSIVKDLDTMVTSYQYQLRNAQSKLDKVNESIETTQTILNNYKNDEIFVSMQESDTAKSTQTTTDYYNQLILQQADSYSRAAELETQITDLNDKIESLNADTDQADTEQASKELDNAIEVCHTAYEQILDQMEEIMSSTFYTTYADHSVAQGKSESFISGAMKQVVLGAIVGIVIACGLWFLSALIPELKRKKEEDPKGKEAAE